MLIQTFDVNVEHCLYLVEGKLLFQTKEFSKAWLWQIKISHQKKKKDQEHTENTIRIKWDNICEDIS